ncbi:RNA polymerase sigma factor, sigma-70 family [Chitinophaga costaii]|uniref:RNA polymerase sigma factor, sigma-70 family n=1 Tax=Chitinophaga costaii TaxID=1335309 RepID=A0A1C4EVJ6_9BACT|nr:sigma-70 family RNA polymerase sigma factor [Chitinophaga costaii]PUZ21619.1 sigma-70 family RNA polymerase sigma factor [Chitinophaga costaii]SCC47668.1 RNA polymerase sigma factor, sigma-70 family [Chitinophaga costaii]
MTNEDSALLLRRINAGGEDAREAVAEFYKQEYKLLYRTALKILQNEVDAEEVVHQLFVDMLAGNKIPREGSMQTFFYVAVKNRSLNIRRSKERAGMPGTTLEINPRYDLPYIEDCDPDEERKKRVIAAVNQLPPRYQQALRLSYWEKRSHPEIAEIMSITKMTSYTLVKKALITLRKLTKLDKEAGLINSTPGEPR